MKAYLILAVFTLFGGVLASGNNSTPVSLPLLPVAHYYDNGTVAWFPKVAGGELVRLGEIDGIVSIQTSSGNHRCTGTLVLFDLVLTSAHCVTDTNGVKLDASHFQVVADDLGITGKPNKTRQIATVSRVHVQPKYNPWSARFDIAILELVMPFRRTPTLRFNNVSSHGVKEAQKCQIAGWGSVSPNFKIELHRINLEIVDINIANGTQFYNGLIPTNSFAASSINGNSSCLGDPGAALICDNHIKGILSFGYGCGRSDFPLVFTDATLSQRWVDGIIQNVTTISPAAAGVYLTPVGAQANNFSNHTQNGTQTTRRPGGGAGSLKMSVGILTVSILHFFLFQYVMKLIH